MGLPEDRKVPRESLIACFPTERVAFYFWCGLRDCTKEPSPCVTCVIQLVRIIYSVLRGKRASVMITPLIAKL